VSAGRRWAQTGPMITPTVVWTRAVVCLRRHRRLHGWLAWLPTYGILRSQSCPSCLPKDTAPPHAYLLAWAIPILLTCPIHRCRLVSAADPTASYYEPPPNPAVTAMDTYTWQALTTGRVTLPGETIPARVWFRWASPRNVETSP